VLVSTGGIFYSRTDRDSYTLLNPRTTKRRGRSVIILMSVTLTLRVEQWMRMDRGCKIGIHESLSK
jgi:hypothetical protein